MSYGALTSSFTIIFHAVSLTASLSLCLPYSLSLSVLYYTLLNGTKLTNAPRRCPLSAKCLIVFFPNISLSPKRGVKKHLDDITDIRFQRSLHSQCKGQGMEVCDERATRLIRISLFQSDNLHCRVNILGS